MRNIYDNRKSTAELRHKKAEPSLTTLGLRRIFIIPLVILPNSKRGQHMDLVAILQERIKGIFPDLMGIKFLEANTDLVKASLEVRPDLCTAGNILHGGAIMAFADTLGAVATVLNLPQGAGTTTIESKTNFFRPAMGGSRVIGECTPLHKGRRTQTWQTRVLTEEGKLVAIITQTQFVLEAKA
jgi:1,4-dihydroxy-2-naphthoyl-CoA hydrolase